MPFPPPSRSRCAVAAAAALACALAGCETTNRGDGPTHARAADLAPPVQAVVAPVTAPGKHATRRDYYVLYHDFELDKSEPLFGDLDALPEQVFSELKLPAGNAVVQVFLFDTEERYTRYMQRNYEYLPKRRAYFLSVPRPGGDEHKIFTWMGEHLATDLRHELTHALLRGALKDVPLWLDEGLAGYFELPPGQEGVNGQHLDALRRAAFVPNLARLEGLTQVAQMEKPEYREAWAWVHFMLRSGPAARKVLHDYLHQLRTDPKPGPLLPRLRDALGEPEQALVDHLATMEMPRQRPRTRAAAPK